MTGDLISKLSEIRSEYNCFDEDEEPYYRALSDAIMILSQRADKDTISRQAVLNALCTPYGILYPIRTVEELPSAEPEHRWIPCSERLPKENVYVLVWCGEVKIARIIHGISKEQRAKMQEGAIDDPVSYGWNLSNGYFKVKRSESYRTCDEHGNNKVPYCWDCIHGEMFGQDVKAWMPLPEPYKGGQDDRA
jgi:hypothetical protein